VGAVMVMWAVSLWKGTRTHPGGVGGVRFGWSRPGSPG